MRTVSEQFLAALTGSHPMRSRARITTTFQEGTDPSGTEIPVAGGDVRGNSRAAIRHTLELVTDGHGWDHGPGGLLTPYGSEVFVERGVAHTGGSVEWVSLGYYRLYTPSQDRAPDGLLRLSGRDRMSGIVEGRLEAPRQFAATATVGDVFDALVHEIYPLATISFDDGTVSEALGRSVVAERDRHQFLRDLATAHGKVMFWDHEGVLRIASPPDPGSPVWDVSHGLNGVLINLARELTRDGVFNAVIASGEGADEVAPATGTARDANPDSPTYWFGENSFGKTFGKVPRFYSSPFIKTNAQARSAAASILSRALGLPHNIDMTMVPNPALEPLDPVRVRYADDEPPEVHVLDEIAIGLTAADAMTGLTRQRVDENLELT